MMSCWTLIMDACWINVRRPSLWLLNRNISPTFFWPFTKPYLTKTLNLLSMKHNQKLLLLASTKRVSWFGPILIVTLYGTNVSKNGRKATNNCYSLRRQRKFPKTLNQRKATCALMEKSHFSVCDVVEGIKLSRFTETSNSSCCFNSWHRETRCWRIYLNYRKTN